MEIFRCEKFFNRLRFFILGIKFSFLLWGAKKNYYVSLGSNCFPRLKLTTVGLKAKKKFGELSCPFDLCVTPIHSTARILSNDFNDYFDGLYFDEDKRIWRNKDYDIAYSHDDNLTRDEFVLRYRRRIKNFKNIISLNPEVMLVLVDFNRDYSVEDINTVYDYILNLRNDKPFKFMLISFVDENSPRLSTSNLNKNIFLKEYKTDTSVNEFYKTWANSYDETHQLIAKPLNDIYKYSSLK